MHDSDRQEKLSGADLYQGTFLGVVLDLSGSMTESIRNSRRQQHSKIAEVAATLRQVLEDSQFLLERVPDQEGKRLKLFILGFGFQAENAAVSDQTGDIFSILTHIDEHIERYRLLQPEVEALWLEEIEQLLEDKKIAGDAQKDLCLFVESEFRERATRAQMKRKAATFQRWCEHLYQRLNLYEKYLRMRASLYNRAAKIALPPVLVFLWLLRFSSLLLRWINKMVEDTGQRKLTELRNKANEYANQQAQKVVIVTRKALNESLPAIHVLIEENITAFIDKEVFKFIFLFNSGLSPQARRVLFDRAELKQTYEAVSEQIARTMRPHAHFAWKTSVFLLKQGARALKIRPDWHILEEKTIRCAQQTVWERISPEVRRQAERIIKRRFMRAILITIAQATKDLAITLSPSEASALLKHQHWPPLSVEDSPVFGNSPLGTALEQTFSRLMKERQNAPDQELRPAILIVSDGLPTDAKLIDPLALAEKIKRSGTPIVCCFVTNRNIGHPWKLRRKPRRWWPRAARLMFSMASSLEEWPEFTHSLVKSRFKAKKHAKFFIQVNHTEHLQNFIEAFILPVESEQQRLR